MIKITLPNKNEYSIYKWFLKHWLSCLISEFVSWVELKEFQQNWRVDVICAKPVVFLSSVSLPYLYIPYNLNHMQINNETKISNQIRSDQSLSRVRLFATPWITARQASLSIINSWSSLRLTSIESVMPWAISSSVVPFSSCPQSLPASESFPMSQLFAWGSQSTGVSALASFLPKKSQDWSPSEWTGWISLQSKGFSRVFSNTTVQKHQFFGAQPSSQSNSHIHTWPQEKP